MLWASTGTKDPSLPDTYYVDTLIGVDTVNTMPPATMKAFRDHGQAKPGTIEEDVEGAEATLAAMETLGISLDKVTHELVLDLTMSAGLPTDLGHLTRCVSDCGTRRSDNAC